MPTTNNVGPTTSATERLRALLTERGVEWTANDGEYVKETCWPYMGELTAAFAEYDNGTTRFACDTWCFTPEQAVAATLGPWTCEDVGKGWMWRCSECKCRLDIDRDDLPTMWVDNVASVPRYCPNCGRRVIGGADAD